MKSDELDDFYGPYEKECQCGKIHVIYSQKDTYYCEYTTEVYITCENCKHLVEFEVSVN